jgi:hypothetical protein
VTGQLIFKPLIRNSGVSLLLCFCAVFSRAQERPVLLPEEIRKLIPEKITGFTAQSKAVTRLVKVGTLSYSLAEQTFVKSRQKIKILLFDYNNALIMYSQATAKWKDMPTIENDTVVNRYIELPNCIGRESFNKSSGTSQLLLGVCDRFYLTLAAEHVELETLHLLVDLFNLAEFQRTAIDNPKSR